MIKSEVYAKHMKATISSKKVAPVMDLVRGKALEEAKLILTFDRTKAAKMILKVLKSAEANAINNNKLEAKSLFLSELWVSGGPVTKSGQFIAKGRFNPLLKRTSHIYVGLSQRGK
jgi:large subunit ribosomal protein L22